jgi:beta-lactam-binding protein with PASTA domain
VRRRLGALLLPVVLFLAPAAEAQTTVRVPPVLGMKKDRAIRVIRRVDLVPRVKKRASNLPKGRVIKQQPNAGSRVNEGRTVRLVVSHGGGGGS